MILVLGTRGQGFNSPNSPTFLTILPKDFSRFEAVKDFRREAKNILEDYRRIKINEPYFFGEMKIILNKCKNIFKN
jgi:hypothetical protein